jgi:hypothetical protein
MNTQEESLYDIFAGNLATTAFWLVAISGFSNAVAVMKRLATKQPGRYFVLDEDGRVVAEVDRREARLSA